MGAPIVTLEGISLKFDMESNRATSLKEFFVRWLRRDFRHEEFWALQDADSRFRNYEAYKGDHNDTGDDCSDAGAWFGV